MTADEIPSELKDILDKDAGKIHSENGRVMQSLARIITKWEEIRYAYLG